MEELRMVLHHLKQPEYVHVLLNPIPLYGMAIGACLLLGGLLWKSLETQGAALILIAVIGAVTLGVVEFGEEAYDRVLSLSNQDARLWLKVHMHRADILQYLFYGTGCVALLAFVLNTMKKKIAQILIFLTLLLTVACALFGGWISHSGGQVRHSEFRDGPPPKNSLPIN